MSACAGVESIPIPYSIPHSIVLDQSDDKNMQQLPQLKTQKWLVHMYMHSCRYCHNLLYFSQSNIRTHVRTYLVSRVEFDVLDNLDHTLTSDPELFMVLLGKLGEGGQLLTVEAVSKELLEIALDITKNNSSSSRGMAFLHTFS